MLTLRAILAEAIARILPASAKSFIIGAAMPFVLALDQGTTSSRAIVFDEAGARARWRSPSSARSSRSRAGSSTTRRRSGLAARRRARGARQRAASTARDLAAIGITNQRETTVLWDRATGEPIATRSSGRTAAPPPLRAAQARGARGAGAREDRPRARPVLLRHQARLAARQRARRARRAEAASSRSARSTPGSSGSSPAARSTSPMRPTPRARCSSTSAPAMGRRAARALPRAARGAAECGRRAA